MEQKDSNQYLKDQNSIIPKEMKKLADKILKDAKEKGKIVSYEEAFEQFPACNEVHEGKEDYYLNH